MGGRRGLTAILGAGEKVSSRGLLRVHVLVGLTCGVAAEGPPAPARRAPEGPGPGSVSEVGRPRKAAAAMFPPDSRE